LKSNEKKISSMVKWFSSYRVLKNYPILVAALESKVFLLITFVVVVQY